MTRGKEKSALAVQVLDALDPRLVPGLLTQYRSDRTVAIELPRPTAHVVLLGHRAAGKTRVLPLLAQLTGRDGFDLDREIERHHRRSLAEWVRSDEASFRAAERARFLALPAGSVVAVGGGFLSLHADLLDGHLAVLVPVTFETYRERLLADRHRPRLRPELSLEEEIAQVFGSREAVHARVPTVSLVDFLRALAPPEGEA